MTEQPIKNVIHLNLDRLYTVVPLDVATTMYTALSESLAQIEVLIEGGVIARGTAAENAIREALALAERNPIE